MFFKTEKSMQDVSYNMTRLTDSVTYKMQTHNLSAPSIILIS